MCIPHHHRDRLPSAELLHRVDVRARLHESRGKGMAQIMKPKAVNVCVLHGGIEHAHEVPRIPPVSGPVGEDILRGARSDFRPGFQHVERLRIHGQRVASAILLFQQRDRHPEEVHLVPLEVQDLTLPESRVDREDNDLL